MLFGVHDLKVELPNCLVYLTVHSVVQSQFCGLCGSVDLGLGSPFPFHLVCADVRILVRLWPRNDPLQSPHVDHTFGTPAAPVLHQQLSSKEMPLPHYPPPNQKMYVFWWHAKGKLYSQLAHSAADNL